MRNRESTDRTLARAKVVATEETGIYSVTVPFADGLALMAPRCRLVEPGEMSGLSEPVFLSGRDVGDGDESQ